MTVLLRKQLNRQRLREDFHQGQHSPLRVDREAGVIYRVKILGWDSVNGRKYLPEAGKMALPLYEGAKCYCDHPAKATASRASHDALGMWRKPVYEADGLYADLHYLRSHPMAERVVEDAERGMGVFGMSHNADGDVEREGGVDVVKRITEVRSVDLVTDPATVSTLWEGRKVKVKVKSFLLEKCLASLTAGRQKRLTRLCEEMGDEMQMEGEEDEGKDHKDHLYNAMRACEDAGDHETAGKIHGILKPARPEEEEDEEPVKEGDGDEDRDAADYETEEARKRKPAGLTEARARALCKLAGLTERKDLLDTVVGLSEEKAVAVLTLARGAGNAAGNAPRSAGQHRTIPESKAAAPASAEEQAQRLLR